MTSLKDRGFKRDIHGAKIAVLSEADQNLSVVNLGLSLLLLGLVVWYAFGANYVGSSSYREDVLKTRLMALTVEHGMLLSQKSSLASLRSLFAFIRRSGLVEQRNIEYVFDEKGLAQAEGNLSR